MGTYNAGVLLLSGGTLSGTLDARAITLTAATAPAATNVYMVRDNTSDLTLNVPTSFTINLAVAGVDILQLGAATLTFPASINIAGTTSIIFNDAGNDVDHRFEGDNNANLLVLDAGADNIGLGTAINTGSFINIDNSAVNRTIVSATGFAIHLGTATSTFTNADPTTIATAVRVNFNGGTWAGTNPNQVYSAAATVRIGSPPSPGTNVTITNAYALWVDTGDARFDGSIVGDLAQSASSNLVFKTSNVADNAGTTRLTIGSNAATAVVTWAACTHTGIVLSGALDANSQTITSVNSITMPAAQKLASTVETSYLYMSGGVGTTSATIVLSGKERAGSVGTMELYTPNLALAQTTRLTLTGGVTTAVATWAAVTHTGFVATNSITLGTAGSALGTLNIAGNTSGTVSLTVAAVAGTWTMTLPSAANTNAGYQLTCAGADSITSWAAAASLREFKDIWGLHSPQDALDKILGTRVYDFHYKPGQGTQDRQTTYVGVMADEAPWAMHYAGGIVNPINALGYTVLAFQAMEQEIQELRAEVAALKGG